METQKAFGFYTIVKNKIRRFLYLDEARQSADSDIIIADRLSDLQRKYLLFKCGLNIEGR